MLHSLVIEGVVRNVLMIQKSLHQNDFMEAVMAEAEYFVNVEDIIACLEAKGWKVLERRAFHEKSGDVPPTPKSSKIC